METAAAWVLTALALVVAVFCFYLAARFVFLNTRAGSFQAWLICPGCDKWRRGIAFYGTKKLAWYRLSSVSPKPTYRFSRASLDVTGLVRGEGDSPLVTVMLKELRGTYKLAVDPRDASGFISWATSSPPGG